MMWQDRTAAYLRSLDQGHGELLDQIRCRARADGVPVLCPETASFLKTLVTALQPRRILEIGTAVGYSALLMAQAARDAHITTVENYAPRISQARLHFSEAGEDGRITLLEGDAGKILQELTGDFDFIFMDAAKGQYIRWLARAEELMGPGAVLVSDNVLQDGDIVESRYAVARRSRTIHSRMREYLYALTHSPSLQTSIVPVGDGVAMSVKLAAERRGR